MDMLWARPQYHGSVKDDPDSCGKCKRYAPKVGKCMDLQVAGKHGRFLSVPNYFYCNNFEMKEKENESIR